MTAANASLPRVAIPELLDPRGEPVLAAPDAIEAIPQSNSEDTAQPAVKPVGDLAVDGRAAARLRCRQP